MKSSIDFAEFFLFAQQQTPNNTWLHNKELWVTLNTFHYPNTWTTMWIYVRWQQKILSKQTLFYLDAKFEWKKIGNLFSRFHVQIYIHNIYFWDSCLLCNKLCDKNSIEGHKQSLLLFYDFFYFSSLIVAILSLF